MVFAYEISFYTTQGEEVWQRGFSVAKNMAQAMYVLEHYYGDVLERCNLQAIDNIGLVNLGDNEILWASVVSHIQNNAIW